MSGVPTLSIWTGRGRRLAFILAFFLGWCGTAIAAFNQPGPVIVPYDPVEWSERPSMTMMWDEHRSMILGEVQEALETGQFSPLAESVPNLGLVRDAVWIAMRVYNPADDVQSVILTYESQLVDEVVVYALAADGRLLTAGGTATRSPSSRVLAVPLDLPPAQTVTLLWRVKSTTVLTVPIRVWKPASFASWDRDSSLFYAFIFGATAALMLYAASLAMAPGAMAERWFLAFHLSAAGFVAELSGVWDIYLPDWVVQGYGHAPYRLFLTLLFLVPPQFARSFLSIGQWAPRLDRVIAVTQWLSLLILVSPLLPSWFGSLVIFIVGAISPLLVIWACWLAVQRRQPYARFFLAGWVLVRLIALTTVLRVFGIGPSPEINELLPVVAVGCGAIIFSALLAYRTHHLERRRREAEQARKIAEETSRAKSDFLAQMSHELRTPLNAIIGFSEVIEKQILGPKAENQYRDYAKDIRESGVYLLSLVNDILDLSKIEAGHFALQEDMVDVQSIVQSCLRVVDPLARQRGVALASYGGVLPPMRADGRAIKQILVNLLNNAIKFTPAGGRVEVAAEHHPDGPLAISISDTGAGIPLDQQAQIFEPFHQVRLHPNSGRDGTGLGLAIVRSLVSMHDGRIELSSSPGHGTCVTILLPASRILPLPYSFAKHARND